MSREEYTREQLNDAVWAATGGDVDGAIEIASGWRREAIELFAAPLAEFVDRLQQLAKERS